MDKAFPILDTERLRLIQLNQTHLEDLFHLFGNAEVTQFYNIVTLNKKEDAQPYLDWFVKRYKENLGIRWGITLKNENKVIGTVGFNNFQKMHRANIGYDLHPDYWNKGYITEALKHIIKYGFDALEVNRIEAEVMQGNIRSERVLEKIGFTKEGLLRNWMYWNEAYYDMNMFSILKSDFFDKESLRLI